MSFQTKLAVTFLLVALPIVPIGLATEDNLALQMILKSVFCGLLASAAASAIWAFWTAKRERF